MGDAFEYFESMTLDVMYENIQMAIEDKEITLYSQIEVHCYGEKSLNGLYYTIEWLDKYKRYKTYGKS